MPELPEVETVRQVLRQRVIGKEIVKVDVYYPKMIENLSAEEFKQVLAGQKIQEISRKGKFLIFIFDHGYLVSHLRMEGKYWFDIQLKDKHSHVIFTFKDGDVLLYHDVRKFGRMYYFPKSIDPLTVRPLSSLGKEPSEIQDVNELYSCFKKKKKSIKQVLLDQSPLCGIGNIYADEICFQARIHPLSKANRLNKKQCDAILKASQEILQMAISKGGSTIRSYQSAHGVDGRFQLELSVYGHDKKPCRNCGQIIKKMKIGGRSSCYCPNCQKRI